LYTSNLQGEKILTTVAIVFLFQISNYFHTGCFSNLYVASNIKEGNENIQTTHFHPFYSGFSRFKAKFPRMKVFANSAVFVQYFNF